MQYPEILVNFERACGLPGPGSCCPFKFIGLLCQVEVDLETRIQQKTAELEASNARLQNLAVTDELTGLNNRRGFKILAEGLVKLAHRSVLVLWLMYIDLDHFKHINDTFGHAAGDAALVNVSRILTRSFRESDVVARLGGDEFAVMSIDSSDTGCEVMQTRLQRNLDSYNALSGAAYPLSLSMGTIRVDLKASIDVLLSQADTIMYADKQRKKQSRQM